ncbi:MAG: hypothetical protein V4440_03010 [Pseudomonadota bacterium]
MAGSSNQYGYQIGQTLVPVGLSAPIQVIPPRTAIAMVLSWGSGGTLLLVNSLGASAGNGSALSTTERLVFDGPATFFLAASGTTSIANVWFKFSSGYSSLP